MNKHGQKLKEKLKEKHVVIMDGGTGTEILRRGVHTTLPLWSSGALLTHPHIVQSIHADYIRAGAEIIITNTFRTTGRTLGKAHMGEKARDLTILAVQLARRAITETSPNQEVYIAGSIAPLEDCYTPDLVPDDSQLEHEHYEHAKNLADGGVDFLLVETMNTIKEALFALRAARRVGLPIAISFCCSPKLTLLSGETLEEAIVKIEPLMPLFISINCTSAEATSSVIKQIRPLTHVSLGTYANGDGVPDDEDGWKFNGNMNEKTYLQHARNWVKMGVQVIGGCCGTTPAYIQALAKNLPRLIE